MKRFKKLYIIFVIFAVLALSAKPFLWWQNETYMVTKYTVKGDFPDNFEGYKILQFSDLHCKFYDGKLIEDAEKLKPDIIVITGDLVDDFYTDLTETYAFLQSIIKIAPVYFVSGNHDKLHPQYDGFLKSAEKMGVTVLENKKVEISKEAEHINLYGVSDPGFWLDNDSYPELIKSMEKIKVDEGSNILLFHRANMLDFFNKYDFDLILSGHLHGGLIRLPLIGGIISPHKEWFPKYSGGKYVKRDRTFIVSRGLGNSIEIPRIFNRPELVLIKLSVKK